MIRNIIGNRVFGGNSMALVSLKVSRWLRDSGRLPRTKSGWSRTSWKRGKNMDRISGQRGRWKIRERSSNVIRNKHRQFLRKINKMFLKNGGINLKRSI